MSVHSNQRSDIRRRPSPRESGFTLFELAIVLVIAALLLGVVLQANSMREEAYFQDIVSTVKDLSEASRTFKERYHYLPGDLKFAGNDLPLSTEEAKKCGGKGADAGNGLINGKNESDCAPLHLARAGLIRWDTAPIRRNFGKATVLINFMSRDDSKLAKATYAPPIPLYPTVVQNVLQLEGVPYSLAVRLDEVFDDGDLGNGKVRACDEHAKPIVAPQNRTPPEELDSPVPYLVVPLL